jgi:hypothetical protein
VSRLLETALIFLLLAALITVVVLSREGESYLRGSARSDRLNGARALLRMVSEMGYNVRLMEESTFSLSPAEGVLFVLAPSDEFAREELTYLESWVRQGGTLIVAQDERLPGRLLANYQVDLARMLLPVDRADLHLPALNWPVVGQVAVKALHRLKIGREDFALHVGDRDAALLAGFGEGKGHVFVMSSVYPFTNEGLYEAGNAQLISNLIRAVAPPGGWIVFDELHRQKLSEAAFFAWLISSAAGRGLLYGAAVLVAYVVLNLVPFGALVVQQPQRSAQPTARPTLSAFNLVTSADLQGETGWEAVVRYHYWERLKRSLVRSYCLDPTLTDDAFLAALAQYKGEVDLPTLIYLLAQMNDEQHAGWIATVDWVQTLIRWQQELDARA